MRFSKQRTTRKDTPKEERVDFVLCFLYSFSSVVPTHLTLNLRSSWDQPSTLFPAATSAKQNGEIVSVEFRNVAENTQGCFTKRFRRSLLRPSCRHTQPETFAQDSLHSQQQQLTLPWITQPSSHLQSEKFVAPTNQQLAVSCLPAVTATLRELCFWLLFDIKLVSVTAEHNQGQKSVSLPRKLGACFKLLEANNDLQTDFPNLYADGSKNGKIPVFGTSVSHQKIPSTNPHSFGSNFLWQLTAVKGKEFPLSRHFHRGAVAPHRLNERDFQTLKLDVG